MGTSGKRAFASFYGPSLIEGINFGEPLLITSDKRVSARVILSVLVGFVISVTEHAIFEPEKVPWFYFNQISSLSRVVNVKGHSIVGMISVTEHAIFEP